MTHKLSRQIHGFRVLVIAVFAFSSLYSVEAKPDDHVVNTLQGKIVGEFSSRYTENSGHKSELVEGALFEIDEKLAAVIYDLIGEELLRILPEKTGAMRLKYKEMIFELGRYLMQMQGYRTKAGDERVYVVGSPLEGKNSFLNDEQRRDLPKSLILPDGGGVFHWQAYIDVKSKKIEMIFNSSY